MTIPIRYLVYGLSTSCITLLYALRLAFHSTIICQLDNSTDSFLHDENLKQYSFQSVGIGMALGLIPLHFLNFLGTRNVTLLFGIVGTLSALFYPTSYYLGFYTSFITRFFQGAPLGILLWLIAKVASDWTPKFETAIAIAILTSVYQLAPFVAQISSAEMCQYFGWEYTYYLLAGVCAVAHLGFYYVYSDRVEDNRFATVEEKSLITEGKGKSSFSQVRQDTPFSQLLRDPTVWVTWFSILSFFSSLLIFLQYGPLYMNQVLGFSVRVTGYSGGLAHIFCLLAKIAFGKVMDGSKMDMTKRLKAAWAAIEIPALVLMLALLVFRNAYIQLVCIVIFIAIHGVGIIIVVKAQTYRSAEHNHVLANGNTLCLVMCPTLQPIIVKYLVPSNSFDEWSRVFSLQAVLMLISIILFVTKVDASAAPWTGIQKVPTKIEKT